MSFKTIEKKFFPTRREVRLSTKKRLSTLNKKFLCIIFGSAIQFVFSGNETAVSSNNSSSKVENFRKDSGQKINQKNLKITNPVKDFHLLLKGEGEGEGEGEKSPEIWI